MNNFPGGLHAEIAQKASAKGREKQRNIPYQEVIREISEATDRGYNSVFLNYSVFMQKRLPITEMVEWLQGRGFEAEWLFEERKYLFFGPKIFKPIPGNWDGDIGLDISWQPEARLHE